MNEADLMVTLGRIEEAVKHMTEKLDRAIARGDSHEDTISRHETRISVLESKTGSWKGVIAIIGGLVGSAGFTLALLDRLYGN